MDGSKILMPRASTMAYKELRARDTQEVPAPSTAAIDDGLQTQLALISQALTEVPAVYDLADTEIYGQSGATLSQLITSVDSGDLKAIAKDLAAYRTACSEAGFYTFNNNTHDNAQLASNVLDAANAIMRPMEHLLQPLDSLSEIPEQPHSPGGTVIPTGAPSPLPPPVMPDESFFLPASSIDGVLSIAVEPSLMRGQVSAPNEWSGLEEPSTKPKGRGRGRSKLTVGQKRPATPSVWTPDLQKHLATALRMGLRHETSPGPNEADIEALPLHVKEFARELEECGACEGIRLMGATLPNVSGTLQVGGYSSSDDFMHALKFEANDAAETFLAMQSSGVRRGKILGLATSFVTRVGLMMDTLLAECVNLAKAARFKQAQEEGVTELALQERQAVLRMVKLPPCIINNREPYRNGDWRKTPFVPRPYVRLQEYHIVEEASRDAISRKLRSAKTGGCDGTHCGTRDGLGTYSLEADGFQTQCGCLSRNTECDDTCACAGNGQCLNRAVQRRETVVIGKDVQEINSWGMDCYTRRNIQDAILESQAFGEYKMPTYKSTAEAAAPKHHAATAAGQHAALAAETPPAPPPLSSTVVTTGVPNSSTSFFTLQGPVHEGTGALPPRRRGPDRTPAPIVAPPPKEEKVEEVVKDTRSREEIAASKAAVERAVVEWIERSLVPAINRQGDQGWDICAALRDVRARAEAANDTASLRAAEAVQARVDKVGYNYFRIHPKGVGLVCQREGGLPRLTFVEEYLGEIHCPWRWFEVQDAVKKITGDELPDFYNIVLERPRDDPAGYDVLFVDAAAKGAFASRMSHSCTPNCQAVVMSCGGRLTIALYTLRHVHEGEELTFDYSSVTESEKEFRDAICLCGTHMCRGSYLYFTGSRAFMQVMMLRHNMLHRQAIIARAGSEPLTDADRDRLKRHGLGESCLGSVEKGDRVPEWLEKWASLICEYLDLEERCLREQLLQRDPFKSYTEATAAAEAKGVVANRLQNVVITLDKVRMVLRQPGQAQGPVLCLLTSDEVAEHLWNGPRSIARKLLRCVFQSFAPSSISRCLASTKTNAEMEVALARVRGQMSAFLRRMADAIMVPASGADDAREKMMEVVAILREADNTAEGNGGLTAAADMLTLYARTKRWVMSEKGFKNVSSPPVPINLQDLFLNREATQLVPPPGDSGPVSVEDPEEEARVQAAAEKAAAAMARHHAKNPALRKIYRPAYCWGQLSGWFKQTVNDPSASLSAERRGTLSLPDVDSWFNGGKAAYGAKERADTLEHMERRPEAMWRTGTQWSFKNESKIYGSPMLDKAWAEVTEAGPEENPLPALLEELKAAAVPFKQTVVAKAKAKPKGRGKRKAAASDDEGDF